MSYVGLVLCRTVRGLTTPKFQLIFFWIRQAFDITHNFRVNAADTNKIYSPKGVRVLSEAKIKVKCVVMLQGRQPASASPMALKTATRLQDDANGANGPGRQVTNGAACRNGKFAVDGCPPDSDQLLVVVDRGIVAPS